MRKDRIFPSGSRRDTDEGKPPLSKLPWTALGELAFVHKHGDGHYGVGNWRRGQFISTYLDSAGRHIAAFTRGEDRDTKSRCYHLAQAIWNLACALHQVVYSSRYAHLDDRVDDFGEWVNPVFAQTEAAKALAAGDRLGDDASNDGAPERHNGGGNGSYHTDVFVAPGNYETAEDLSMAIEAAAADGGRLGD